MPSYAIRLLQIFAICTAFLSASFAAPPTAQAYTHLCGKFFGVRGNSPISYRFYNITGPYYNAANGAAYRWNLTRAPGYFRASGGETDPMVEVYDDWYSWESWGNTWGTTTASGCTAGYWSWNEVWIDFNARTMNSLTAREKKIVAEHEFGHAYGLDHVYTGCTNPGPALMRQGPGKFACGGDGPWNDDVQGVIAKY